MRKIPLVTGEYYHVFNQGVDKRPIFSDRKDLARFFQSMSEFNSVRPIGSIHANSFLNNSPRRPTPKLVEFIAYSLNHNHYHFLLEQLYDNGISEFMKRLGGGYGNYFNIKHGRHGALFQGKFKSIHVDSNEYLLHLSAYINLNDKQKKYNTGRLIKSSWEEYIEESTGATCKKDIVLKQFKNKQEYKEFAEASLENIIERKSLLRSLEPLT